MSFIASLFAKQSQNSNILANLKSGKFEGLDKDVYNYLLPVLSDETEDVKNYGIFAVQFLHISLKSPGTISTDLLSAVEHCYKCIRKSRHQIQLNEALAVPKLLYHILIKIPIKGFHSWRITICQYLYDELAGVVDGNHDARFTIINSGFSHVWNLTVKQEQEMEINDWQILQLRHIALKILLLKDGTVAAVIEKFMLVLTRFEKGTTQKDEKVDKNEFPVIDLVADILNSLNALTLSDGDKLSLLSILQFLLRYGLQNDIAQAVEYGVANILTWTERFENEANIHDVFKLFLLIGRQLLHWMRGRDVKGNTEENLSEVFSLIKLNENLDQNGHIEINIETLPTFVKSIPHDKLYLVPEILLVMIKYMDKINLPIGECFSVFQSFVKVNCILLSWQPDQDKHCRMIVDLVQNQMKVKFEYVKNYSGDQFYDLLKLCEELTQTYNTILCNPGMKVKDQDRHYCGYLMSKLAHMCFEKDLLQLSISFYKVACIQLSFFVNSENSLRQTRMEEVSLGKVYLRLAETYLKCGETSAAMETITSCVLLGSGDLIQSVALWVRIKKDLLKTKNDEYVDKTLGQTAYEQDNTVDLCCLLQTEYDTFKSIRKRYYEAEVEILQQLISVTNEPFVKGKAMLEMAQVLWQSGLKNDSDIKGYLRDSAEILSNSTGTEELLGQVLLWQYVIENEDFCQQILSSTNVPMEVPKPEAGEESEIPVTNKSVYMTVAKEVEAIKQLDRAAALWESLDGDVRDVNLLQQSVMICCRIYQLLNKPDKQLQVMKIFHQLSQKHATKETTDANSCMINCLLSVDMVTEAEKFVDIGNNWDKQIFKEDMVNYQITRSRFMLYNKQYDMGISLLKDILTLISQKQNSTWTVFVLEGRAKRLMSQYMTYPGHVSSEYCLDYACEAVRFHTGVVHFLMGKEYLSDKSDIKKGKSVDKWTALTEILESLFNLGCLYSYIGEAREAKCYLKEGWKVSRYYGLPAWNIKFSSEIIKLSCKSDKGEEAVTSLLEISEVLPSSELASSEPGASGVPPSPEQPSSAVHIPECIQHILEQKYCRYCQEHMILILQIIPVIADTYVALNDEKLAILFLEKAEFVTSQLVRERTTKLQTTGGKSTGNKVLHHLYLEIVIHLAELNLNVDREKCHGFLNKALAVNSCQVDENKYVLLMLRHKLCHSLYTINWQNLQKSSSDFDQIRTESTDDILNCSPVLHLANKLAKMSVTVDTKGDNSGNQTQFKGDNRIQLEEDKEELGKLKNSGESNDVPLKNNNTKKADNLVGKSKNVEEKTKEPKRKRQNVGKNKKIDAKTEDTNMIDSTVSETKGDGMLEIKNSRVNVVQKKSKTRNNTKPKSIDLSECQTAIEEITETPLKSQPKLAMKTPRSVCSRKAILDLMCDSDDDDIQMLKSQRKTRPKSRKQPVEKNDKSKGDVYQFSEDDTQSKNSQSKIPRPVSKKGLFTSENDNKVVKQKSARGRRGKAGKVNAENIEIEASRHDDVTEEGSDNKQENIKIPCDNHVTATTVDSDNCGNNKTKQGRKINKVCPKKTVKSQKTIQSENRTENLNSEIVADNLKDVDNKIGKKQTRNSKTKGDVTKIESKTSNRIQRSKVGGTERNRSESDSEDDKMFVLDESLSVKDEESVMWDIEHGEVSFTVRSRLETEDLDNVVLQEVTQNDVSLNESIEILRGDNKTAKGSRKGKAGKKNTKETEEADEQPSGETTEVLRSSKLLKKSQLKTERIVKMEPVLKTTNEMNSTNSRIIQTLEEAYKQMKHLPSPPVYTSICQMLALQYMELSPLKAAFYLAESIAVTFRHQSLINAARKIRKSNKANEQSVSMETSTDIKSIQKSREILHFNKTEEEFKTMMADIPEDWSVCQLSVMSHSTPSMLVISRVDKTGQPIIVQLPGFNSDQGRELLPEFSSIINESKDSVKVTDKNEWWKWRGNLDNRMQAFLENIENHWLGRWKFLLLGHPVDIDTEALDKATEDVHTKLSSQSNKPINKAVIKVLLESGDILTTEQLDQVLINLSGVDDVSKLSTDVRQFWSKYVPSDTQRHHVILLLDKTLQNLPLESIPILRSHSLSRLPSLYHMISYLSQKVGVSTSQSQEVTVSVVDKHKVYYVLNPDNNLPSTQETFQNWFEKNKGWQGIVGKPPTAEENKKALTEYDLLVYCGHGTGSKYLSGDDLQQLNCRAAVLLMGCSSGQLLTKGQLEASGMMLNYFLANCPCIISNLWDVTDKDIDRFLEHLLQQSMSDQPCDVLSVIPFARDVCRLPYLIGAAPVVYGFPFVMK